MASKKSSRKQNRRIANDALALQARFWSGQKTVWSGSTVYRPINKDAVRLVKPSKNQPSEKTRKKSRNVSVYLFRVHTKGSDEIFLKIGITNSLVHRFEEDQIRYRFSLLCSADHLTRKEALSIERRLHGMFSDWAYNPRNGFVSGGHTECFVDYEPILSTTKKLFELIEEEKCLLRERLIEMHRLAD